MMGKAPGAEARAMAREVALCLLKHRSKEIMDAHEDWWAFLSCVEKSIAENPEAIAADLRRLAEEEGDAEALALALALDNAAEGGGA
ncbi:hypothetical protein [Olsenella uli]